MILIQHAFHLVGESGEGIVEQIDGVIELRGVLYFVEMKWYEAPVGKAEIAEHLVRLISQRAAFLFRRAVIPTLQSILHVSFFSTK